MLCSASKIVTRSHPPRELHLGGVAEVQGHPVLDSAAGQVLSSGLDRGPVAVDAVDPHLGVGARDGDARAALSASDVGDPGGWVGGEARVDIPDAREPLAAEEVVEHRAREPGLALVEVGSVVGVGHASPVRNASSSASSGRVQATTSPPIGAM